MDNQNNNNNGLPRQFTKLESMCLVAVLGICAVSVAAAYSHSVAMMKYGLPWICVMVWFVSVEKEPKERKEQGPTYNSKDYDDDGNRYPEL